MPSRAVILAHHFVLRGGAEFSPATVAVIRRTLESLAALDIRELCVVDGERAHELAMRLELHTLDANVEVRSNPSWRQASGAALLSVRDFVERDAGPCLVIPADRPLDTASLEALCAARLGKADAAIVAMPYDHSAELSDVCRVKLAGRKTRVRAIGCDLADHDALFAGHALIKPSVLDALEPFNNPELCDGLADLDVKVQLSAVPWPWGEDRAPQSEIIARQVDAILDSKSHPKYTLLNPGPVNTTARVKSAMVHHDVCHRDSNFSELLVSLSGKLRRIFRGSPQHTVCLITGSGTAAMECAISSAVPRGGKILVIDNGAFGERALEIARLHEMDVVHLRYPWGDQVDPADVERALELDPSIDVVTIPHHETSVGLLNPVREIGALCRRHDALLIVDAVSSLGAEDLDVVRDNIDICFSSANKCLHAISGAGFLCVAPRAWHKIEHVKPRSYYLDLKRYRRYADELAHTPFTPAVSAYFALETACDEFLADGHAARWAMYRARNRKLRDGLAKLGMAPFTRTGRESHSVVTACVPDGVEFPDLYAGLKQRGYIVYGCKEVLADRFFQVANMGELSAEDIDDFLAAAEAVISELRRPAARRATA